MVEARPKRRPSQSPSAIPQRWRSAARAAPEMEILVAAGAASSPTAIGGGFENREELFLLRSYTSLCGSAHCLSGSNERKFSP